MFYSLGMSAWYKNTCKCHVRPMITFDPTSKTDHQEHLELQRNTRVCIKITSQESTKS